MPLAFSTKAGTLALLQRRLQTARIAPLVRLGLDDWRSGREACLLKVREELSTPWIVRSSCHQEDSAEHSKAGAFLTLANVTAETLDTAIDQVIASYGSVSAADEVLVQPMLAGVVRSGVAFSHDPNTAAPYRVVNWSEGSDTSVVTGGLGGRTWQGAALSPIAPPKELAAVIGLLDELLRLFGGVAVDCEFAVTHEDGVEVLWLLQARSIVMRSVCETPEAQWKDSR